jgi:tRNA (cmo5U34)-methyltransferase
MCGCPVEGWRFHSRRWLVLQDIVLLARVRVPLSGRELPVQGEQKGAETSVVLWYPFSLFMATIDAPLAMELITQAAISATPVIHRCLDIGCGAGNYTLKLLKTYSGDFDCDLCDLSEPMLLRAEERLSTETSGVIRRFHGDIRELPLPEGGYDVILAAAVLHHLREEHDWERTFRKLYALLRLGGAIWITDLVTHEHDGVHALMWRRYADYLIALGGKEYQEKVFTYIDQEDSPRPVTFQLELLKKVGFRKTEILHKNSCFAAFGAVKV